MFCSVPFFKSLAWKGTIAILPVTGFWYLRWEPFVLTCRNPFASNIFTISRGVIGISSRPFCSIFRIARIARIVNTNSKIFCRWHRKVIRWISGGRRIQFARFISGKVNIELHVKESPRAQCCPSDFHHPAKKCFGRSNIAAGFILRAARLRRWLKKSTRRKRRVTARRAIRYNKNGRR